MTLANSKSNNKNFSFSKVVEEVFSFLGKNYKLSFVVTEAQETVRFESKNLKIELRRFAGHDPTIYFMNVSFNYQGKGLEFADLISMENPALPQPEIETLTAPRNYPATTLKDTQNSLSMMADLIRQYGHKLLH